MTAVFTGEELTRLRRHIAGKVVGDSPPPLTSGARDLIKAMLDPTPARESR